MKPGRVFIVFYLSLIAFMLVILLSAYNVFYKTGLKQINELQYYKIKTEINNAYMVSKYDLMSTIRDDLYTPVSSIYLYDKKDGSISLFKGNKPDDNKLYEYLSENIKNIIYLEDGFGYIVPLIIGNKIYIYAGIEKGDDIYISIYRIEEVDNLLKFCLFSTVEDVKNSQYYCKDNKYREVFKQKFFSIKYLYNSPINVNLILLLFILFLIIGAFLSYWVSRHFDLEEKRLIDEIRDSIAGVENGKIPLISVKSLYPSYNLLIEKINTLIQKMTAEIDKHRVVYNEHFKNKENEKAIGESINIILSSIREDILSNDYPSLLKSFDLLIRENGGVVRFKGVPANADVVRKMIFVMLEIIRTHKDYNLVVEAEQEKIIITSENRDFMQDKKQFIFSECKNIIIDRHTIIIG